MLFSTSFVFGETMPASRFHVIRYPSASSTCVYGVSNTNVAVGIYFDSSNKRHGFTVTASGVFTTIDIPTDAVLQDINSSGTIVGYYTDASGNYFAFRYANGTFTDIGPPGSIETLAFGINDDGVISGAYLDPSTGIYEGWIYNGSTYETLFGPQNAEVVSAHSTNLSGLTSIQWNDASGYVESSIYNGSIYKTANVPGAVDSEIYAINNAGDASYSWEDSSGNFHAAVLVHGKFTKFDGPGCVYTYAYGLNDHRVVVGTCEQSGAITSGFYVPL